MFTGVCLSLALVTIVRCLWVRRATWQYQWERSTTITVVLMGCALLLTSPIGDVAIGSWFHTHTGTWHMENLVGHLCCLAGLSTFAHGAVSRLSYTDAELRKFRMLAIGTSAALYVPLLTAAFILAQDELDANCGLVGGGFWQRVYTVVLCCAAGRLLWHLMRELLILRTDPRSKVACDIYLVSIVFAFGACAARLNIMFGTVVPVLPHGTGTFLGAMSVSGFAYAATRSWREKTRWLKPVGVAGS